MKNYYKQILQLDQSAKKLDKVRPISREAEPPLIRN